MFILFLIFISFSVIKAIRKSRN